MSNMENEERFARASAFEERVWRGIIRPEEGCLTTDSARTVLRWGFPDDDRQRFHELTTRAEKSKLTPNEQSELRDYRCVDSFLAVWREKAERSLGQ